MRIPKNVAKGMIIGGLVGMVGSAGAGLYDSLTSETTSENSHSDRKYTMGAAASLMLFGVGLTTYRRRKAEEYIEEQFGEFRSEVKRYITK